jgi:hypothetical protein
LKKGYDLTDLVLEYGEENAKKLIEKMDSEVVELSGFHSDNKQQKQGYRVIDMNTLMKEYDNPPKQIIEHMVVEKGVSIISGTDGVGKSWICLQMAFDVSTGKDFLDFKSLKRPVLVIQFELSPEQLAERLKSFQKTYGLVNQEFLDFALLEGDMIFTNAWEKVRTTILENGIKDGVVIIDNIYASTAADLSNNQYLKPVLQKIEQIKNETGNAIVLIAHHNKTDGEEPILNKDIISGGKTFTNYVSNVLQIGNSSFSVDCRRAKITKVRDGYCDLLHQAFRLDWNPDKCLFTRGGIIANEMAHCKPITDRWEYGLIIGFSEYESQNDSKQFDRNCLWQYLSTIDGWEKTPSNETKVTRFISRLVAWGLIIKMDEYNKYQLNWDEIANVKTFE